MDLIELTIPGTTPETLTFSPYKRSANLATWRALHAFPLASPLLALGDSGGSKTVRFGELTLTVPRPVEVANGTLPSLMQVDSFALIRVKAQMPKTWTQAEVDRVMAIVGLALSDEQIRGLFVSGTLPL